MKNKNGFTLVELLAVIVVLATIMVLAVPAVVDSMNNSKKKSFALFGQKMINEAETKFKTEVAQGNKGNFSAACYKFTTLAKSTGSYSNGVVYKKAADETWYVDFSGNGFKATRSTLNDLTGQLTTISEYKGTAVVAPQDTTVTASSCV